MSLAFAGPATRLTPAQVAEIAAAAGVEYPYVQAVTAVEASGTGGFLVDGRPKILFEAAHFHAHTKGAYDKSHPNLSSPVWNRALYAHSTAGEYDRLGEAVALDRPAALLSCSWGMFQIMGENFEACGFSDVEAFVAAMVESEKAHLEAFLAFVRHENMLHFLLAQDWAGFARRYNGPGYAQNHYDTRLADAFHAAQSAPPPAAHSASGAAPAPVASCTLNVRTGPGVLNPITRGSPLTKGQPVTILQRHPNGWVQISFTQAGVARTGWVNASFLA